MKFASSLSALVLILASPSVFAGTLEVIGEGQTSAPAEFLKLEIDLEGSCFASASQARRDLTALTETVTRALEPFTASDIAGAVQVNQGNNSQRQVREYIHGETVTVCDESHAWAGNDSISFKLRDASRLAELQDRLLNMNAVGSIPNNTPRLKLTFGAPVAGVFETTYNALVDRALQLAYENALRQARILVAPMGANASVELTRVRPTQDSSGHIAYDQVFGGGSPGVSPRQVRISMARLFVFRTSN